MDLQHVNIKFFAEAPEAVDLSSFIGIFNGWIQEQFGGALLIDVADYRHVVDGPGVVLIGHAANYSLDNADRRLGLLYNRKAHIDGTVQDKLAQVVRVALLACRRLEEEHGLKFGGQEVQLTVNDRLLAPNTDETFQALAPELRAFFDHLYGGAEFTLRRNSDPRERFTVDVMAVGSFGVPALLKNLASSPDPLLLSGAERRRGQGVEERNFR